jgi:uncharacterized protein YdaU (DUF1376 family)
VNYYKRHLGDYARDTGHLTALEHGIYGLLLDWYYANEKPIPADKAVRIARGNPDETQSVLSEFFKLTPEGWRHFYADRVIREYNAKADRNREVGKLGGRPSKTKTVSKENPQETLATSHKPVTIIKEEAKATVQPTAAPRRSSKDVPYSEDFERFWKVYPNKQKKQEAMNHWAKHGLEGESDWLIDHVRLMQKQDDGWIRGYAPMGSTYLNGKRWEDVPRPTPRHQLSKSAQGLIALQEMGNGLDGSGSQNGFPEIDLPRLGSPARIGAFGRNGNGMGGSS